MLLRSKVAVVSDKEKTPIHRGQVSVKELNKLEPLKMCRNNSFLSKLWNTTGNKITVTETSLLVTGQAALRRQELYTGLFTEHGKLPLRCAISLPTLVGIQGILKEADA